MYIYLTSNGSQTFFSENSSTEFRIRLSRPVTVYGRWEIAILQVSLPHFKSGYSPAYIDISTSVCLPSILNGSEKPILNRIFFTEIIEGACIRFHRPYYLTVNTENLHVIDINLYDDKGDKPSFDDGEVCCTLHLRTWPM